MENRNEQIITNDWNIHNAIGRWSKSPWIINQLVSLKGCWCSSKVLLVVHPHHQNYCRLFTPEITCHWFVTLNIRNAFYSVTEKAMQVSNRKSYQIHWMEVGTISEGRYRYQNNPNGKPQNLCPDAPLPGMTTSFYRENFCQSNVFILLTNNFIFAQEVSNCVVVELVQRFVKQLVRNFTSNHLDFDRILRRPCALKISFAFFTDSRWDIIIFIKI